MRQTNTLTVQLPSGDRATIQFDSPIPTVRTEYGERNATALERVLLKMLMITTEAVQVVA